MDSHDLFRQLTKGVKFSRHSTHGTHDFTDARLGAQQSQSARTVGIKQEATVDSDDSVEDAADFDSEEEKCTFQFMDGCEVGLMDKVKSVDSLPESIAMLRKDNRITVRGKNIPAPVSTFEELRTQYRISEQLLKNMFALKYVEPTPIQMQAIPILLHDRPLMAAAPTGSGKTVAYLMPILNMLGAPKTSGFRAIVMAPTRELSHQIYRECVQLAAHTALKIHMVSKLTQTLQKYESYLSKKFDVLVSTPNRVRYLVQQQPPLLNLQTVEWFVIDEADRLMEDGKDNFKDQLDGILENCTNPKLKLVLFSATYTSPVAKWALRNVKNLVRVIVGQQNSATNLVDQELLFVGSESGKLLAVRDMVRTGLKPPVLIFVQSKDRAKELFQELLYDGINVDVIHADRTQQQRDNCVRAFREGFIWVLICTELMGRGIDFKGVNLVINYDFPPSVISYIHRIGRTGRAGRRGKAITFFTQSDTRNLRSIAMLIKNSGGKIPDFTLQLKKPRKSDVQKLANSAPQRESISTQIRPEPSEQQHTVKKNSMAGPKTSKGAKRQSSDQALANRTVKKVHIMNTAKDNVVKTKKKPQKN